jgi:diguanylate cyclase
MSRTTLRVAVATAWVGCGLAALVGRDGPEREQTSVLLTFALVGLLSSVLVLPRRWLPYLLAALGLGSPLLVFYRLSSACSPLDAVSTAIWIPVTPLFAFVLWGRRMGALATAFSVLAVGGATWMGRLPVAPAVSLLALLVIIGVLQGWTANQAERLETDPVTGAGNRRGLERHLERALAEGGAGRHGLALVVIDLDGVRRVNAVRGRSVGDRVLADVADALARRLPEHARAFHLGAGQFVVVLADDATATCETVEHLRAGLHAEVTASAGLGLSQPDDTGALLLARAESSLLRAKAAGRDRLDPLLGEQSLLPELTSALRLGQFIVLYQPIVHLGTGRTVGCEALVRWDHPVHGRIAPDTFIPLAEESGLIHDLGRRVLTQACDAAVGAERAGIAVDRISVNASGLELRRPGYDEEVLEILRRAGLDPRRLTIEVTESSVASEESTVASTLARLRQHGVRIAIDDFGTGYSSLSRLGRLPVDVLKIDKSFVWADGRKERDSVLTAIISLAGAFGLSTVAEGIETWDHAELLADLGCTYGQGYLFGRPGEYESLHAGAVRGVSRRTDAIPRQRVDPVTGPVADLAEG